MLPWDLMHGQQALILFSIFPSLFPQQVLRWFSIEISSREIWWEEVSKVAIFIFSFSEKSHFLMGYHFIILEQAIFSLFVIQIILHDFFRRFIVELSLVINSRFFFFGCLCIQEQASELQENQLPNTIKKAILSIMALPQ